MPDPARFTVSFEMTKDEAIHLAGRSGWLRDEPRKPWKKDEIAKHARQAIKTIVADYLANRYTA